MAGVSSTVKITAALAVAGLVGYCVYFDYKRRADPEYKTKLRAKRLKQRQEAELQRQERPTLQRGLSTEQPGADMQLFLKQELALANQALSQGDFSQAGQHFANCVRVYPQPEDLLRTFQEKLPPQVFAEIISQLTADAQ